MSAELLDHLSTLWLQNFRDCNRRAHWHLANVLRFEAGPLGALFSQLEGHVRAHTGADPENTKARLGEMSAMEFAIYDDPDLSSRSIVRPTEKLESCYRKYHHELVRNILEFAGKPRAQDIALSDDAERVVYWNIQFINREMSLGRERYICARLGSKIEQAHQASYAMRRRSHWTTFMAAWLCHKKEQAEEIPVNDIVAQVLIRRLPERQNAIEGYIADLVSWRFLDRKGRGSYTINAEAASHFEGLFSRIEGLMRSCAERFEDLLPPNVVKLRG